MTLSLLVCLGMLLPVKVIPLPGGMVTPDSIENEENEETQNWEVHVTNFE